MSENSGEHSQGKITRRGLLIGALASVGVYAASKLSKQERPVEVNLPFSFEPIYEADYKFFVRDIKDHFNDKNNPEKFKTITIPDKPEVYQSVGRDYHVFRYPDYEPEIALAQIDQNQEIKFPVFGYPVAEVTTSFFGSENKYLVFREKDLNPQIALDTNPASGRMIIGSENVIFLCQSKQNQENFVQVRPGDYRFIVEEFQKTKRTSTPEPVVTPTEKNGPLSEEALELAVLGNQLRSEILNHRPTLEELEVEVIRKQNFSCSAEKEGNIIRSSPLILGDNKVGFFDHGDPVDSTALVIINYNEDGFRHKEIWLIVEKVPNLDANKYVCYLKDENQYLMNKR